MSLKSILLILRGGLAALVLAGCVSVNIGSKPPGKSTAVKFWTPPNPFAELSVQDLDKAWKNKNTGNTISFKTGCEEAADPSLAYLHKSLLEGIDAVNVENSETTQFNNREALHSVVSGRLDGVQTRMELMIFKKNNCSYTITYVGLPARFENDRGTFKEFLKEFEAP